MKKTIIILCLITFLFLVSCNKPQKKNIDYTRFCTHTLIDDNANNNTFGDDELPSVRIYYEYANINIHIETLYEYNVNEISKIQLSNEYELYLKEAYASIENKKRELYNERIKELNVCAKPKELLDSTDIEIINYFGSYGENDNIHIFQGKVKGLLTKPTNLTAYIKYYTIEMRDIQRCNRYIFETYDGVPLVLDLSNNETSDLIKICEEGKISIDDMETIYTYYFKVLKERKE